MTREEIIEKAFESYPDYCNCIEDYDLIREANHQQDIKREAYIKCWEDNFANHPQLPANLDEAAKEYDNKLDYQDWTSTGAVIDAFKAGAEWMIERVISWLKENGHIYLYDAEVNRGEDYGVDLRISEKCFEDLRKSIK